MSPDPPPAGTRTAPGPAGRNRPALGGARARPAPARQRPEANATSGCPSPARSRRGRRPPRTHLPTAGASDRGRPVVDVALHHRAAHVHPHHVPPGGRATAALLLPARHRGVRRGGRRPPENHRPAAGWAPGRPMGAGSAAAGGGPRHRLHRPRPGSAAAAAAAGRRGRRAGGPWAWRGRWHLRPHGGEREGAGFPAATAPAEGPQGKTTEPKLIYSVQFLYNFSKYS